MRPPFHSPWVRRVRRQPDLDRRALAAVAMKREAQRKRVRDVRDQRGAPPGDTCSSTLASCCAPAPCTKKAGTEQRCQRRRGALSGAYLRFRGPTLRGPGARTARSIPVAPVLPSPTAAQRRELQRGAGGARA